MVAQDKNNYTYLLKRWSPLTHTSHCMTTSRPAAATQTRARPAMHPCQMPFHESHKEVFVTFGCSGDVHWAACFNGLSTE